jgi:hypothetical protein
MKQQINMVGGGFQHDVCSSAGSVPEYIEWVKDTHDALISIHIDYGVQQPVDKTKLNFAWIQESSTINVSLQDWIKNNVTYLEENFELVFVHDTRLLPLSNKFKHVICNARSWVKDIGIHPKTKLVSMIASNKVMCYEHMLRQQVVNVFRDKVDLYGRGHNEIPDKIYGLKDYCFSITMENHTYPLAYSEKLSDCFATGTIPIYYGCEEVNTLFNPEGILWLYQDFKIEDLSFDLYYSKIKAIEDNFNLIKSWPIAEDYLYYTYIKDYDTKTN